MAGRHVRLTVRTQLTAAATLATLLMVLVASLVILSIQRRALTEGLDEALQQRADNLQPIDASTTMLPREGDAEDSFTQLLDRRGQVVASSPNLDHSLPVVTPASARPRSRFETVQLESPDGRFRVLVTPIQTSGQRRFLVVGRNLDDVNQSADVLQTTLALVVPVLALLVGVLAWWLTGRMLRPVTAIRRQVDDIGAGDLDRRVPVPPTDDEIADLAQTMNAMLDRVESANTRQLQFVSDASHELRTPLTRMINDLELSLAHDAADADASHAAMARLLEEAVGMQQLIRDLLYVARATKDLAVETEVDLDDVATAAASDARSRSSVPIDTTGIAAARIIGDPNALARAVTNLLENAVRHARSQIAISTKTVDGWCVLAVDDDGSGIDPEDRSRVFDRFTRLDEARTRDDGGSGLGLAIVQDIAIRHGGHVTASEAPLGGSRIAIRIPSADEPSR